MEIVVIIVINIPNSNDKEIKEENPRQEMFLLKSKEGSST